MHGCAKTVMVIWSIICGIGLFAGMANVSSISTSNEFEEAGAAIGTAMGLGFWVMLWFFPMVVLGIVALVTKPKENGQALDKPNLCPHCGKYYTGSPAHCPNCGQRL
jgi:hypothetical protein